MNNINTKFAVDMTDNNFEWVATVDNVPVYIWAQAEFFGGGVCFWDPVNGYQIFVTREVYNNKKLYLAVLHHELAHAKNEDPKRAVLSAIAAVERGEVVANVPHVDVNEEIAADAYAKACGYGDTIKESLENILENYDVEEKYAVIIKARIVALSK